MDYEQTIFGEYVNAGEGRRLELERLEPGIVGLYEHSKVFDPWSAAEARELRALARQIIWDPQHPASHHGDYSELARENCAVCVLHGWAQGLSDEHDDSDGPNWAGWQRVYVQAGVSIPDGWRESFAALLNEHTPYAEALGRDVATFGLMDGRGHVAPLKPRPLGEVV